MRGPARSPFTDGQRLSGPASEGPGTGPRTRPFRFGATQRPRADEDPVLSPGASLGMEPVYRVVRLLGEGGMGRVYEAVRVADGHPIALKVLRRERHSPQHLARFRQEAEATSRIGHPNIVAIHDYQVSPGGAVMIAMERLAGESLEDWMARPGRLADGIAWLSAIAMGLHAAHGHGIVHRDLKPANLFLHRTADGVVPKILDFGIAKVAKTEHTQIETAAGTVLGTPYYLAPERALGQTLDARADLYSLGVILYEVVTGALPFEATSFVEILALHARAEPLDPRQAAPDRAISPALARLVMQLLRKRPEERPATAEQLGHELATLLASDPSIAAGTTGPSLVARGDADTIALAAISQRPTAMPGEHEAGIPGPSITAVPGAAVIPHRWATAISGERATVAPSELEATPKGRSAGAIPRWGIAIAATTLASAAAVVVWTLRGSTSSEAPPDEAPPIAHAPAAPSLEPRVDPAPSPHRAAQVDATNEPLVVSAPRAEPEPASSPTRPAKRQRSTTASPSARRSATPPTPSPSPEPALPAFKDDVYED